MRLFSLLNCDRTIGVLESEAGWASVAAKHRCRGHFLSLMTFLRWERQNERKIKARTKGEKIKTRGIEILSCRLPCLFFVLLNYNKGKKS